MRSSGGPQSLISHLTPTSRRRHSHAKQRWPAKPYQPSDADESSLAQSCDDAPLKAQRALCSARRMEARLGSTIWPQMRRLSLLCGTASVSAMFLKLIRKLCLSLLGSIFNGVTHCRTRGGVWSGSGNGNGGGRGSVNGGVSGNRSGSGIDVFALNKTLIVSPESVNGN